MVHSIGGNPCFQIATEMHSGAIPVYSNVHFLNISPYECFCITYLLWASRHLKYAFHFLHLVSKYIRKNVYYCTEICDGLRRQVSHHTFQQSAVKCCKYELPFVIHYILGSLQT